MELPRHPVKVPPHPNRTQTVTKAKFPATAEALALDHRFHCMPRVMTTDYVRKIIAAFAAAASRNKKRARP